MNADQVEAPRKSSFEMDQSQPNNEHLLWTFRVQINEFSAMGNP